MNPHSPSRFRIPAWAFFTLFAASAAVAQTAFSVGTGGTYPSIQAAVNACPASGCVIVLNDSVYHLDREVWIEGKSNLSIRPSSLLAMAGIRPRLWNDGTDTALKGTAADPEDTLGIRPAGWKKWPNTCTSEPGGSSDTVNPLSTQGYASNGLVVVTGSSNVRLEGLVLDGIRPQYFVNKGVWSCKYDVLFGNVGINLLRSKNVVVRDCEIRNFFAALFIDDMNSTGIVATGTQQHPAQEAKGHGAMGEHVVEHNIIHDNWWAIYDQGEWDLGSTFRFNRCIANRNTNFAESNAISSEANNMAGGFLYVKDVPRAIHRIHNNTIWASPLVIGHGAFKPGVQHLFYNNIVGGFTLLDAKLRSMVNDWRQLMSQYSVWMENNLFEVGAADSIYQIQKFSSGQVFDSAACAASGMTGMSSCWIGFDEPTPVLTGMRKSWLWNGWKTRSGGTYAATIQGKTYLLPSAMMIEQFPGGGFIDSVMGLASTGKYIDISSAQNVWVKSLPWKSTTLGAANYFEPNWDDSLVLRAVKSRGRKASGWSDALDLGAVVSNTLDSNLQGPRSQLEPSRGAGNCWRIPLRIGSKVAVMHITSVRAWSTPFATDETSTAKPPTEFFAQIPANTSIADPSTLDICLEATPAANADIRFQIESEGALQGGSTVGFEPAYFLVPAQSDPSGIGVRGTARTPGSLHLARVGNQLVAGGLPAGAFHLVLRSLDGRVLRDASLVSERGAVSFALPGFGRKPVLVQIRQGDHAWQGMTTLF